MDTFRPIAIIAWMEFRGIAGRHYVLAVTTLALSAADLKCFADLGILSTR